jgi:esterase/lipase superfamily enzyme
VKIARKKGDYLGPFLNELVSCQAEETKISFLCHSMGNRIFQHMMLSSGLIENGEQVIDHYIAAGADIESKVFDKGKPLENLNKVIKDVTIYVHNNDRSLKMSKLINKNKRLGLNGLDPYKMPENFSIIDVSVVTDHMNFSLSMSNHRYFYMSPTVAKDIKRMIWEKDFATQKKKLDHPRRLKLMTESKTVD